MAHFKTLTSVTEVLDLLRQRIATLGSESICSTEAGGRVLAEPVVSEVNVPAFARSAMDGYALRAEDVPGLLRVVGQSLPGQLFAGTVRAGEAVRITTGAPIPDGANAVAMIERTEPRDDAVLVGDALATGRNVIRVGEDVAVGREVLAAGRVLRPQDLGLLAAIGVGMVPVVRRPRVALVATGGELLPPGSQPQGNRIVDSNSPMLAALVHRDGGLCAPTRYVPDSPEALRDVLREESTNADLVLVTGGTSVGSEDHAAATVASLGELAVHGVNLRPGKPMGVGFLPAPVFLLPGNPGACLGVYELFAGRAVRRLAGRNDEIPHPCVLLTLGENLRSQPGRVDIVWVRDDKGTVTPLPGGASSLSGTVAADGFLLVPAEREQLNVGEAVEVYHYAL